MYTREVGDAICEALEGGASLRAAAREAGISHSTVLGWTETDEVFRDQYTRARARGYATWADDILDETTGVSAQDVAAARLRFDAKRWMLSKMLPKVYGDKLDLDVKGTMSVKLDSGDGGVL